jgi:hypothetical protein
MSCLYSSPEVRRTKVKVVWERAAIISRTNSDALHAVTDVVDVALNKNAFPTRQPDCRRTCSTQPSFPA